MKPFVRHINMNHVFPTRYQVDFTSKLKELDSAVKDLSDDGDKKVESSRQSARRSRRSSRIGTWRASQRILKSPAQRRSPLVSSSRSFDSKETNEYDEADHFKTSLC